MSMFARKIEPIVAEFPKPAPAMSEEVAGFIDKMNRQREELAYFKSECTTLTNELKLANERIQRLDAELVDLRDQHWRLLRHDTTLTGGLDQIKVQIVALLENSKKSEYAPPGTGTQSSLPGDQSDQILSGLINSLKPNPVATDAAINAMEVPGNA